MKVYLDRNADLSLLKGRTIAILGFGSQGKAQALNLRDSGLKATVGLPPRSESRLKAQKAGFRVYLVSEAVKRGDLVCFLFPDHLHQEVFESQIKPNLRPGQVLIFAAGFSVHFKLVKPPKFVDVILVAPHSPGSSMRELFVRGRGVPAFLGVAQNHSGRAKQIGLAYAKAIGCTKAVVMETTFEREALGDLFGEQAILCGGLSELVSAGFETLVKKGLPPENAYLETLHQLDLLSNLLKEKGVTGMYKEISLLAAYGSYKNRKRIIGPRARREMERVFDEIKSGKFAAEFLLDYRRGLKNFKKFLARNRDVLLDRTAGKFRKLFER
jgi:ketol-acid reductoisomerase